MARQCFDFMVQSVYEIPENVMRQVMRNVLRRYSDFQLQASEPFLEKQSSLVKVYSTPIMVNGSYTAYIGKSMPILVQLLDWHSGVNVDDIKGKGREYDLAIMAYNLCNDIITSLEDAIYQINNGRIQRDNIKYKVQMYLRIS